MPEEHDLTRALEENASGPREARSDNGGATQHSLTDQIKADQYLASKRALRRNPVGFRTVRLSPGGNTDYEFRGGL